MLMLNLVACLVSAQAFRKQREQFLWLDIVVTQVEVGWGLLQWILGSWVGRVVLVAMFLQQYLTSAWVHSLTNMVVGQVGALVGWEDTLKPALLQGLLSLAEVGIAYLVSQPLLTSWLAHGSAMECRDLRGHLEHLQIQTTQLHQLVQRDQQTRAITGVVSALVAPTVTSYGPPMFLALLAAAVGFGRRRQRQLSWSSTSKRNRSGRPRKIKVV